jgi:cytochrome P450
VCLISEFKHLYRRWVFFVFPWVTICSADAAKDVLQTATPKGEFYNRLKPWLGEGLLIATGKRWFKHRRMLTPAFHFNVLKGFVDIYSVCCVYVCVCVCACKWLTKAHHRNMQQ